MRTSSFMIPATVFFSGLLLMSSGCSPTVVSQMDGEDHADNLSDLPGLRGDPGSSCTLSIECNNEKGLVCLSTNASDWYCGLPREHGEECWFDGDCQSQFCSEHQCVVHGENRSPCSGPSDCSEGFRCSHAAGNPYPGGHDAYCVEAGGGCDEDPDCAAGSLCEREVCVEVSSEIEGQHALCSFNLSCALSGLICRPYSPGDTTLRCEPPGQVGEGCNNSDDCAEALLCTGYQCVTTAP